MQFLLIVVISLLVLGAVAALFSMGGKDEPIVTKEGDCASCTSRSECKLAEIVDKSKKACHLLLILLALTACSTKKNTPQSRWWQSLNARYNTYYNGQQAFIDGTIEKENGNKDNYTELIPLYAVGYKQSRDLGKGNFSRAIETSRSRRRPSSSIASRYVRSGTRTGVRPRRTLSGCHAENTTPLSGVPGCCWVSRNSSKVSSKRLLPLSRIWHDSTLHSPPYWA